MTFLREIGWWEAGVIALFFFLYLLYGIRMKKIGKHLRILHVNLFIKVGLRSLYFSLFLLALLGPLGKATKQPVKFIGKDIFICVDLSRSMNTTDVSPSRIEKVKFEMKRIAKSFRSDRIGIIIFSSEAFMQCPLTFDQNAIHMFIETISTNLVPNYGTDFAPPLKMAIQKLKENRTAREKTRSKIIVLISDGEDFGENTDEQINSLIENEIALYTLGVGTSSGGPIPYGTQYKTDPQGKRVISKLNNSSLQDMAKKTDGKYFEISSSRNDITRLMHTITKIEGEVREARMIDSSANQYIFYLLSGFIFLLLDLIIRTKAIEL